jgi:hypothetical protein
LTTGYVDDVGLLQAATDTCTAMQEASASMPPHAFTTDGCSAWPDSDWRACCIEHDMAYWCGGKPEQRESFDREFQRCVAARSNPFNAWLMHLGVRIGGWQYGPWPWRWGYGYDWPFKERSSERKEE